ncbi:MAG TPA: amidohydrolase family protein [Candidatus Acidoferrum sp.]|nr:amidohydrolase family protein [Candidatus Acidoferrum sp.]
MIRSRKPPLIVRPREFGSGALEHLSRYVLLALSVASLFCSCSSAPPASLAITHVTLIDATGAAPKPDTTVLIADKEIAAIGPSKSLLIPRHTKTLDATGKFLIPGLVDMHVHLTGASEPAGSREFILPLLLANGITTVRDMGGDLDSLNALRHEIDEGKLQAPRIFFAGPYLDGKPPFFQPSLIVTNSAEAVQDVHSLISRGADFIKVQSGLSREAYFAIADVCRLEHITFVGHVPDRVTAGEAADAGQKSIEHLTGVLRACSNDEPRLIRKQFASAATKATSAKSRIRQLAWQFELLQSYSDRQATVLIERFLRDRTWQVPTLILLRNDAFPTPESDPSHDPRRKYIPIHVLENWEKGSQDRDKGATPEEYSLRGRLMRASLQIVGKMQRAGVPILSGTDTTAPFIFPGSSLHEELALLVQAGLTPMQALQAATKLPAEFLGSQQTQGTIEKGKLADLVLLNANPLDDIHNTERISAVILRGKLLDRIYLDELLTKEENFARAH